ncbi:MAG: ATP-binding protein [Bacteroidales bacterium]|nr:ATP-binding protein [Bacteroidales bacterium]
MSEYIHKLIAQGEHQQQDFKFEITDSKKIARSLVAFANTDGGRLLIGVKDNGAIAGVRSEEEYYMVEAAAQLYCQPEVYFTSKEWTVDGRMVLEITVPKSTRMKHKAPAKEGEYKFFIRVKDQNLLANSILVQLWKRQKHAIPVKISFTNTEMMLLRYLSRNPSVSLKEYMKMGGITKRRAEKIVTDFILTGIIHMEINEKYTRFSLIDHELLAKIDHQIENNN